ncbi:MAG TPA: hypothetical protein VNA16_04530 [Abditibacteriaceae bacterium]|nr:hypothetical protein [Abditibacteriaceae bacterium]
MPVTWRSEACDQAPDPESGASIVRLTQAAKHSVNIYCEQPYTSPDGKRIAIMRSAEADPRLPPFDLYVADLDTLRIQPADRNAQSILVATVAWSGMIYYVSAANDLVRLDITTLEKQIVWTKWPFAPEFMLQSVSPDHRYVVGVLPQSNYDTALVRVDLKEKSWKVLLERPELFAGHLQYMPVPTADGKFPIMGLLHRGKKLNNYWHMVEYPTEHPGTCYYVVDNDGDNFRLFPSGPPLVRSNNGHSAWIAETGRIAFSVSWDQKAWQLDSRWPQGNLFTAAPTGSMTSDEKPQVFHAPEHRFNHVSVSRCGQYFVCDSYPQGIPGPVPLVVGNFETGKYRNIVGDCKATCGGPACSHPHAYFTADNKHVIYNADPHLLGQVYAARVPENFLAGLS